MADDEGMEQCHNLTHSPSSNKKRNYKKRSSSAVVPSFAPQTPAPKRRNSRIDRRSRLLPILAHHSINPPRQHFISRTTIHPDGSFSNTVPQLDFSPFPFRNPLHNQFHSMSVGESSSLHASETNDHDEILDLGLPSLQCQFCGAYFWKQESLRRIKKKERPVYALCCQHGKVDVPLLDNTPPYLEKLLDINGGPESKHFRSHIRSYNAAFSWTSFGAKLDPRLMNSRGPYSLVLCGENYHYMGSLLPPIGQKPRYLQLYVHDPTSEVNDRLANLSSSEQDLRPSIVEGLKSMLDEHNVLAKSFRQVRTALQDPAKQHLRLRICGSRVPQGRQYNLPTGTELAGLIPGDFCPGAHDRDIIVNNRKRGLMRITSLNPLYDSLHFPLLFPHGNDGFHTCIRYNPQYTSEAQMREHVTQREYYCFRLQFRDAEGKTLLRGGKALQHFCIDAFTTIEQHRLLYLRLNQKNLRSDTYKDLYAALDRGELDAKNLGRIILPSSFTGGIRYMKQLFLDAVAISNFFGNPDLFITFTSNAQWPEIKNAFKDCIGLASENKPQIVARVFRMKLLLLKDDLNKKKWFGKTVAGMHTVEFQKRGLPHVHILIWLSQDHKLDTSAKIDSFISAELPDPSIDPIGYAAVTKYMVHGPCGTSYPSSPCMADGKCKKFFPKAYTSATTFDKNGYAIYRRQDTRITTTKSGHLLDNGYVVPYNRALLVKYQAHINVEVCHKGQLIKYLFKYITKGPDRSSVVADNTIPGPEQTTSQPMDPPIDEIAQYLDCRSISSYEAVWRLFQYPIHERTTSVVRLCIHLPGEQPISFEGTQPVDTIISTPGLEKTMLTQWFSLNRRCPSARKYTYDQIPNAFVWSTQCKDWAPRKKGFAIGRIAPVQAAAKDLFYLRILLGKIPGALSYEGLRTFRGVTYPDYQKTCQAMGLLSTDEEWDSVMAEVARWGQASVIRSVFVSLLIFCQVGDPSGLFARWKESMSEDFTYRLMQLNEDPTPPPPSVSVSNNLLHSLQKLLATYSTSLSHFNLPKPTSTDMESADDSILTKHLQYNHMDEERQFNRFYSTLNIEQKSAYDSINHSLDTNTGKLFFLHGHGGTGKTYLYNCIISKVRSQGHIALVVASSGIAATLLPDGVTAHSRFKIPIEVDHMSTCMVKKGTELAELLQNTKLIVWDEAPMVHRLSYEAVDRSLCDIMNMPLSGPSYRPFGGKTVLLGGDFRQTLPVVLNGGRQDAINASLKCSYLWDFCTVLKLSTNMRISNLPINTTPIFDGRTFSDWVLSVGNGTIQTTSHAKGSMTDYIHIPPMFLLQTTENAMDALISKVYSEFDTAYHSLDYIKKRAIVTPTNSVVSEINEALLHKIPGVPKTYLSSDTLSSDAANIDALHLEYPVEYLNSLSFNGIPEHTLKLKPFTTVMLLRNLNPAAGLCNGTRILLTDLGDHVLRGLIVGGTLEGTVAVIPRIVLDITEKNWTFTLKRRQYPVRLCYAMTINKSQGQTLDKVGLYLPTPVFSHGQLYVAVSRVRSADGLHILINNSESNQSEHTRNIVYEEILDGLT